MQEALRDPYASDVEARRGAGTAVRAEDELGGAAPDVDDERVLERRPPGRHAPVHERCLLAAVEQARREAVAPFDLAEKRLAVLRVADGARRDGERSRSAELLELPSILGEAVADARDGDGEEATPVIHSLAEPGDRQLADDLLEVAVLHVGDEKAGGVRPEIDRGDARHRAGRKTRSQCRRAFARSTESSRTWSCARER